MNWTRMHSFPTQMTLSVICMIMVLGNVLLGDCAPMVDDSLQSRVTAEQSPNTEEDAQLSGIPSSQRAASQIPEARDEIYPDDTESSELRDVDVNCKSRLRTEVEKCLEGFELQRHVYEDPDLTTQQRNKLTPEFCTAYETTLHCLYFALQKCSTAVVTDFLPLIELRIGVWRSYMQQLCNHGNSNNQKQRDNHQQSQSEDEEEEERVHIQDDKSQASNKDVSEENIVSSKEQHRTSIQENNPSFSKEPFSDSSELQQNRLDVSPKSALRKEKLPQPVTELLEDLAFTEETIVEAEPREIDCSVNALSPQCAYITGLWASSSAKPSQTICAAWLLVFFFKLFVW